MITQVADLLSKTYRILGDLRISNIFFWVGISASAPSRVSWLQKPGQPVRENQRKRKERLVLAKEFRKLWGMKLTVILIVIRTFEEIPKGLEGRLRDLEIRGRVILQHCWDQVEYWEESWRPEETFHHSSSSERPSANHLVRYCSQHSCVIAV